MDENVEVVPLSTPIQGKADWRNFRSFRLKNGVTCLLAHDKESKTTSAACAVNVGAGSDPRSMPGLAHFAEHMVFLGSAKYSGENEYKRYLASHGGRSNASTSMSLTNYKFEVLAEHAEKAIDIFSQFFVEPLFTASGTGREVHAVDSENSKNLSSDARRRLQILKSLADPNHYYSKFSTGNASTLPTKDEKQLARVREALLTFHRYHYRPDNLYLVVAGPQSLDTLQEWVVPRFSEISTPFFPSKPEEQSEVERLIAEAARDAPNNAYDQPKPPYHSPFRSELQGNKWPVLLTTKPLRSVRKLALMFPIPSDRYNIDRSPSSILSHLLGHEGPGSAFSVLQNNGMISSLSAGPRTRASDFILFQVDLGLTKAGEERWKDVVDTIFQYCRLLQDEARKSKSGKSSELERLWQESCDLDRVFFDQTSPSGVYSYAPTLAERLVSYGPEKCLSAGSRLGENKNTFPLDDFIATVKLLTPQNCIIERCSEMAWAEAARKEGPSNDLGFGLLTEKWYGVEYHLDEVHSDLVGAWESTKTPAAEASMYLPKPNRYIPRTLELCPELPAEARSRPRIEKPIDPPTLLINNTQQGKLYHRLDDRYALPKASITILVRNPATQGVQQGEDWEYSSRSGVLSSVLASIFNEAMAQQTYDADLAGLYWSLSLGPSGLKISLFGFSDRLADFAKDILQSFLQDDFIKDSHFVSTKDRTIRSLKTYFQSRRADAHALYYRDSLLGGNDKGIHESLSIAEAMTIEDVRTHHQAIISNPEASYECLYTGNVSADHARNFFGESSGMLQAARRSLPDGAVAKLRNAEINERRLLPGHDIEIHFQSENSSEENGAVLVAYQSQIPGFKGQYLSPQESLHSSSSIRLLSHILREPLFDQLRTKETLGYIVGSYYETGYSHLTRSPTTIATETVPVDFLTISVLSRKMSPPEVLNRIDTFLADFRKSLETMPESTGPRRCVEHQNAEAHSEASIRGVGAFQQDPTV